VFTIRTPIHSGTVDVYYICFFIILTRLWGVPSPSRPCWVFSTIFTRTQARGAVCTLQYNVYNYNSFILYSKFRYDVHIYGGFPILTTHIVHSITWESTNGKVSFHIYIICNKYNDQIRLSLQLIIKRIVMTYKKKKN